MFVTTTLGQFSEDVLIPSRDFADEHPEAEVIGVDLSPIQPEFVPVNCKFEVDDVTDDWTWPTNHFDMIHSTPLLHPSLSTQS